MSGKKKELQEQIEKLDEEQGSSAVQSGAK
jgi:hypothetical protein